MGVCCSLKTCNLVLNMAVMEFVLGQSLMVKSTTGIMLYGKVCPFIMYCGNELLLFTRKLDFFTNFYSSLHVESGTKFKTCTSYGF